MTRTRVPRWTPPLAEALRLAWRPALAYLVFAGAGSLALMLTTAWYHAKDVAVALTGIAAGMFGVVLGQLIAILRVRALPVFVATGICVTAAVWLMALARPPGGEHLAIAMIFFCFAFPCGLLSLMHRWELVASFWPAVGFIGSVFIVLNENGRVAAWHRDKTSAWLPVPLALLACFLVLWLLYLAAKQAARVEMWQALSGAAARRVSRATTRASRVAAVPRRNVLPLLVLAALLFGATALLAPYLWRTGRGDRDGGGGGETDEREPPRTPRPDLDGEAILEQLERLANAAKHTLPKLWPLLLLLVLYRPTKRALLLTHLKTPVVPTPPSERIDNLWEYVRIAAEDADVVPTSADSVEQLVTRIREAGRGTPALEQAAAVYVRTRYGFTVRPGDPLAMRRHAIEAAAGLRQGLGVWARVKNHWRPLS